MGASQQIITICGVFTQHQDFKDATYHVLRLTRDIYNDGNLGQYFSLGDWPRSTRHKLSFNSVEEFGSKYNSRHPRVLLELILASIAHHQRWQSHSRSCNESLVPSAAPVSMTQQLGSSTSASYPKPDVEVVRWHTLLFGLLLAPTAMPHGSGVPLGHVGADTTLNDSAPQASHA
jgi:hypothetical protein